MHPKIELSLYPSEIRIAQNSSMDFTIKVSNTGDTDLSGLHLSAENTWFYFDASKFDLKKNESRDLKITISVPLSAEPGSYSSVINIMDGTSDSKTMTMVVYALGAESKSIENITFIDREKIMQDIKALELEIGRLEREGYDVADAEKLLSDAKAAYEKGNDAGAVDYLSMAANAIKNPGKKTRDVAYYLIALAIILIAAVFISSRLVKRNIREKEPKNAGVQNNSSVYETYENNALEAEGQNNLPEEENAPAKNKKDDDIDDIMQRLNKLKRQLNQE